VVIGGSAAIEAIGVATGWPFGGYRYAGGLGPQVAGVPLLVPLAWAMMAYPCWIAAVHLVTTATARVLVAGWALAAWDVFLDPQMVAAGRWEWRDPFPALPGVPGVPAGNYLAWLAVGVAMMAAIAARPAPPADRAPVQNRDLAPLLFLLWTHAGSVVAHALLLGLPGSALWGGLALGLVAVPLAAGLERFPTTQRLPR
jgi:putative membrane protein